MGSYAVSVVGSMAGQAIVNSLGFRIIASTAFETPGEALELAKNVRAAWQTHLLPTISLQYTFEGVTARGVTEPGIAESAAATVATGGKFGDPLPTFVAVKVKFRTDTPGRAGRGRTGLPGLIEGGTLGPTPNRASPAEVAAYQQAWLEFRQMIAAASQPAEQVVISRFSNKAKRVTPISSVVTSHTVEAELGTRVSRLR
jgi:hypothetical protein